MATIKSHKELLVWQKAMDAAMRVFGVSERFPAKEQYSLTDQIRRSSRSVAANLSEAWRKRRYAPACVAKLNDAEGEAAESQTHLEIARRCGYLDDPSTNELDALYEEIIAMIATMANHPEKWCLPGRGKGREL